MATNLLLMPVRNDGLTQTPCSCCGKVRLRMPRKPCSAWLTLVVRRSRDCGIIFGWHQNSAVLG